MPIENVKPPAEEVRIAENVALVKCIAEVIVAVLTQPRTGAAQIALQVCCWLADLPSSVVMDEVERRVRLLVGGA